MIVDIIFSIIFIGVDIFLWKYARYLKQGIAENKDDDDPEVQRTVKIAKALTIVIPVFMVIAAIPVITWGIIPLLSLLFGSLVESVTNFIKTYGGYILLAGAGVYWLKNHKPKKRDDQEPIPPEIAVLLARQRGKELQKYMLAFLYRIIVATRSITSAMPPNDEKGIAMPSANGESFYNVGDVVVYQVIVPMDGEITTEVEDDMQDECQDAVPKYVDDFPELIDSTRNGYPPVEILTVRGVGRKVIIDAVIATEKSIPFINARRQARIERRNRQDHEGDAGDPLFR